MRIHQLIEELNNIDRAPGHRPALEIVRILDGNKKLFSQYIEPEVLNQLLRQFGAMAEARPEYYKTEMFRREFDMAYGTLMFYLRKVV
jgi:hypothetical protein